MNQGQERFYLYILERVKEDKLEEAKALLAENFKKQEEGSFSQDDIISFVPKIVGMLKPDKIEEVQAVMKDFSNNLNKAK
jgi:predicted RND superfamily exporter protein